VDKSVGIILQARMGSSRLPGKVLKPFFHTTLLGWILDRLAALPWSVVTATSHDIRDDPIERFCKLRGALCFRGDELDVLDRYYRCAKFFGFDHVVRLTGDNPFPDISILRKLIKLHISKMADYTYSFGVLPIGVGAEIFSLEALERSWLEGCEVHHREHVNEFILENQRMFRVETLHIPAKLHCSKLKLTIDTLEDYERILNYFATPPGIQVGTRELIEQCSSSA
jgi:spore coat polysaccharide biosynthesis protein SpsF